MSFSSLIIVVLSHLVHTTLLYGKRCKYTDIFDNLNMFGKNTDLFCCLNVRKTVFVVMCYNYFVPLQPLKG